ncbi:hypothetical protein ACFLU6_07490 [Acidobacteriota bacterium]
MNIEEAINTALEYENNVVKVYEDALTQTEDPVGKRVFKVLADEERNHVEFLEHKLNEWKESGAVTVEELETAIPSAKKIAEEVGKLEKKITEKDYDTEIRLLKKALDVEIETSNFYKRMVDEMPEEHRPLFKRFVEIEEGHQAIVQAEMDSVSGNGFWFDMQEFNLEAG